MQFVPNTPLSGLGVEEIEQKLLTWADRCEKLGADWAGKHAQADYLDDHRKSVLAALMPGAGSIAEQERIALTDPTYGNHLIALRDARHAATAARVAYDTAKIKFEALRTVLANRREEVRRGL